MSATGWERAAKLFPRREGKVSISSPVKDPQTNYDSLAEGKCRTMPWRGVCQAMSYQTQMDSLRPAMGTQVQQELLYSVDKDLNQVTVIDIRPRKRLRGGKARAVGVYHLLLGPRAGLAACSGSLVLHRWAPGLFVARELAGKVVGMCIVR